MNDETNPQNDTETDNNKPADPVRRWTFIVAMVCLALIAWYLASDRRTPYTSQARVHALVVPIAAEVSGTVAEVLVANNEFVSAGDVLFQIDPTRYELAVEMSQADLQSARQTTGASEATVAVAEAQLGSAIASMVRAEKDAARLRRIKEVDPGAISDRRIESADATLEVTRKQVDAARANLRKAREDLGETGEQNVRVLQAQSALDQALINLERTSVRAPADGLVTDVRLDRGNFANAGAPQMTFIAVHNIWVQADFTENNLGNIKTGDEVDIAFDALPGRIFSGRIRSLGYGVAVDSAPLGSLPTIDNNRQWLRSAQRFPVIVDIESMSAEDSSMIRVGSQASVQVYTGSHWILNPIAWLYVRLASLFSYAY